MTTCRCGGKLVGYFSHERQTWMIECVRCKRIETFRSIIPVVEILRKENNERNSKTKGH